MRSKWYKIKPAAIQLRKRGISIRKIEKRLIIPRSTLSNWFRDIKLSPKQRRKLLRDWRNALLKARKQAVLWHNQQKEKRLEEAKLQARNILSTINTEDAITIEIALSLLYLGEGFKSGAGLAMGNSDPLILKFFIAALRKIYSFNTDKIKCELHLRADQNPIRIRKYWSKELGLPISNFTTISVDKRTAGSITYASYKGVCVLRCGQAHIQRRLLYLSRMFCEKIITTGA